jgi:nucleoside-diphosphate-sugar epimerase
MILVTGANGFLGSWISALLNHNNLEWYGLCRNNENLERLKYLPKSKISAISSNLWIDFITQTKPKIVISCDWDGVINSKRNDRALQISNITRVLTLGTASKKAGVKKFITFGSQAENGPLNKIALERNYDLPTSVYGQAKVETRKSLFKLFDKSDTQLIWGRIFSTYGQTDNPQWLIPSMVKAFMNNERFSLTSGEQEWSYLHAYDFALAVLALCKEDFIEEIINIGNPTTIKIIEVANKVATYMNCNKLLEVGTHPKRSDQVFFLKPDVSNLVRLGWSPKISIDLGLASYVNWFRQSESSFQGIKITNFA